MIPDHERHPAPRDLAGHPPPADPPGLPLYLGRRTTADDHGHVHQRLSAARKAMLARLPAGTVLQVGYAHAEAEGLWIDAVLLIHRELQQYRYRWTPTHEETWLEPVTALCDFRPYILMPRFPELRSEDAWYDAKEYAFSLRQEQDQGGHPSLFYEGRRDLPLLLRPVPRSGAVDFSVEIPRLFSPEVEDFFRNNPEALAQWARSRLPAAEGWSALARALAVGIVGAGVGHLLASNPPAIQVIVAAAYLGCWLVIARMLLRGADSRRLLLHVLLPCVCFVLGVTVGATGW